MYETKNLDLIDLLMLSNALIKQANHKLRKKKYIDFSTTIANLNQLVNEMHNKSIIKSLSIGDNKWQMNYIKMILQ